MYGKEDFCTGTVNSGRTNAGLHSQLGMYVKTLPLRTKIAPEQTILEILQHTHQNLLLIDEHQDMPGIIQNKLRLDTLLVLQNPSVDYENIYIDKDLHLQKTAIKELYSRLPLLINFISNEENLKGNISYNADYYSIETIELITMKYEKILSEIIKNPNISLASTDIELPFEKESKIEIGLNF